MELCAKRMSIIGICIFGQCATKIISNKLCSRLFNDDMYHQVALEEAEMIMSSYDILPTEPALDFFDMDKMSS